MTVFLAHAPADQEAAEALENFLERRGQFVERDDGQTALRPIQRSDVLVLLVSKDLLFAPMRLRLEQRALDAWADGRLIVVKLDHGIAPVGLRDLPAIDASFAAQREFTWQKVADAVREALRPRAREPDSGDADAEESPRPPRPKRGPWRALLTLLLALPGVVAIAALVSIWLVNRIGPTLGGFDELRAGVDAFGVRYGMPGGLTEWLFVGAIGLLVLALVASVARLAGSTKARAPASEKEAAPKGAPAPAGDALFVSYARANAAAVMPVIDGAREDGRQFWLDQQGIAAGDGWAGEIVRAIKGAAGVVVMCSKAAFESDHVKREIYLADRYRKKVLPVFIEAVEPPEDFEYFFAGVQHLNLFETPEGERANAFSRALGVAV